VRGFFLGKNMKYLFALILLFTLILLNHPKQAEAQIVVTDPGSHIVAEKLEAQAQILEAYLASHNSPMQYHAQDFIDAAKEYDLDWKLLPAIAGVESTFGKHIPGGYNAYGWAIYTPDSRFGFKSWREGMFVVAKGLREDYINKGLTDPYAMNRIYAASPTWGTKVTFFMNKLEVFAQNYPTENTSIAEIIGTPQVAVLSGQLSLD